MSYATGWKLFAKESRSTRYSLSAHRSLERERRSDQWIASALKRAGRVNRLPKNFWLILDPVADYDDSSSGAERHHSRYKCQIKGEEETRTIYIDYNYLRVPPEDLADKEVGSDGQP